MFIRKAFFYTYMNHAVSGFYNCFYKLVQHGRSHHPRIPFDLCK